MKGSLTTFEDYIEKSIGENGGFEIEGAYDTHKEQLLKLHERVRKPLSRFLTDFLPISITHLHLCIPFRISIG